MIAGCCALSGNHAEGCAVLMEMSAHVHIWESCESIVSVCVISAREMGAVKVSL